MKSTLTLKSITLKDQKMAPTTTKDIQSPALKTLSRVRAKLEVSDKITSDKQDNTLIIVK